MSNIVGLESLQKVLESKNFIVPPYQRGYAWKRDQWSALWNDLDNLAVHDAANHFMGMLMVQTKGSQVEVVDGQQRLTTAMILANALRVTSGHKPITYPLVFAGNEELQNQFDFHALGLVGAAARISPDQVSSYAKNIKGAAEFFKMAATTLGPQRSLHYLELFLKRFQLFELEVADSFDIHVAFETLNNRGLQLSKMELLKNRLIYLCSVLPGNDELNGLTVREEINKVWRTIYSALGRTPEDSTDDDAFLDAHATIYYGKAREKNWLRTKLFDIEFSIRNHSLQLKQIQDYIHSLELASLWWSHIHQPRQLPPAHQKALIRLNRTLFSSVKPLLLSAYLRASRGTPGAIIDPISCTELLAPVVELMIQAERFGLIVFRFLGNKTSLGRSYLDNCAYSLLEPSRKDPGELPGLAVMNNESAIQYVADYLHAWATNKDRPYNKASESSRFDWSGEFSEPDLAIKAIEQKFRGHNAIGYYGWHFTRLALFNYEESFHRDGHAPAKLTWDQFSFDETVEHIFPQTPDDEGYWDKAIPIDGRSNQNDRLRLALVNSIGNLLFLSRSDNSSAARHAYTGPEGKKARYEKHGYSAAQVARIFKKWDALAIAARGIAILKKCEERWDFQLVDDPSRCMDYLPLVFGDRYSAIADGKAGTKISEKLLSARVSELMEDFGR